MGKVRLVRFHSSCLFQTGQPLLVDFLACVHISYTTHIASLHYIENLSTYFVSRRHLRTVYFTTSLQEHREVNKTKQTPSLSGTFEHLPLCDMYGDVHHHVICVETFTSV